MWIGGGGTNSGELNVGLQAGGRWFWSDKWGLYLELGGGSVGGMGNIENIGGGLGVTMKL
jgi:hypothetical protein